MINASIETTWPQYVLMFASKTNRRNTELTLILWAIKFKNLGKSIVLFFIKIDFTSHILKFSFNLPALIRRIQSEWISLLY